MASPFPGMNPYLENPLFGSEIHSLLITAIFRKLNPQLRPKYKVAIEKRIYQTTTSETVKETYLEVRDVITQEVITVIEILSPKNKRLGEGRNAYQKKRLQVLESNTNLVEIDLLREGKPIQQVQYNLQSDYQILVSRASKRPKADLYPFNLQNPIPSFALPLRETDAEPLLDIQTLINELYVEGNYDLIIDYNQEPVPPSPHNTAWIDEILKQHGLR